MNLSDQKDYKKRFYLPHEELLDGVGEEAEQFDLPCPNLATAEKTMSAAGVMTTSVRSRQLCALSPASSRASGGARVCARVKEDMMTGVRRVFIGTGTTQCYYTGAPGGSHLKDTWRSCNT